LIDKIERISGIPEPSSPNGERQPRDIDTPPLIRRDTWTSFESGNSTLVDDTANKGRRVSDSTINSLPRSQLSTTRLIDAIKGRDASMVKAELDDGADIMARCSDSWTAIHHAVHSGSKRVLRIILESEKKKDIDATDLSGKTPLHIAASRGKVEIGSLLLDFEANINASDKRKQTPLHVAVAANMEYFVEMLLDTRKVLVDRNSLPKRFEEIERSIKLRKASASRPKKEKKTSTPKSMEVKIKTSSRSR
jgi:ankyrin repeat protein